MPRKIHLLLLRKGIAQRVGTLRMRGMMQQIVATPIT